MSVATPMSPAVRKANYEAQNGTDKRFTPAQMRRAKHKFNSLAKVIRLQNEQDAEEAQELRDALDEVYTRPCGGTEFCITKTGNKASKTHKGCE